MLHPILITGAVLVGLPVLLHLIMRQRPKPVRFPAFRFLTQKRRINQRKVRLRHILLLLLRVLLIAVMCLALFQPRVLSGRFNLQAERPAAAVLILDTSPSMGYTAGESTRLDEARRRARELLDALPAGSLVAVLDTGDGGAAAAGWGTVEGAKRRVAAARAASPVNYPVTAALARAYRLFQAVDRDPASGDEPLQRFLAVFSDRTPASWQADRLPALREQRSRVPPPAVNAVYFDVGARTPVNLSVTDLRAEVDFDDESGRPFADLTVTLTAAGRAIDTAVVCKLDGEAVGGPKPVRVAPGETATARFRKTDLAVGLHQAEVTLNAPDGLAIDNSRYVTFVLPEPVPVLAIADGPRLAASWKLAAESNRWFRCDVRTPAAARDWAAADWNRYRAVCLVSVAAPPKPLWDALKAYLERGGALVTAPGRDVNTASYTSAAALAVLPGTIAASPLRPAEGKTWLWNSLDYGRPVLAPFREWERLGNVDFLRLKPRAYFYWPVEPAARRNVIVPYDDGEARPALLEKGVGRGKSVMFTTPMDTQRDGDQRMANDYTQTSFYFVLPNLVLRDVTGYEAGQPRNFLAGQAVEVPLPLTEAGREGANYALAGPGVAGEDAIIAKPARPGVVRVGPGRLTRPGNFTLTPVKKTWVEGFSVNVPAAETVLAAVEPASIESHLGEGSVVPLGRKLDLDEVLERRFDQPVNLFPWLMMAVLLILAGEGLLANRFYRRRRAAA